MDEIEKLCAFYRGTIIQYVINIEEKLDYFLLSYFLHPQLPNPLPDSYKTLPMNLNYEEKGNEFLHTILEKENFNLTFKAHTLSFLMNKHCLGYISEHSTFMDEIADLIALRNSFGHRKLDKIASDIDKKEVVLIYHTSERKKAKTEKIMMNPEVLDKFIEKYESAYKCLVECGELLIKPKILATFKSMKISKGKTKEG